MKFIDNNTAIVGQHNGLTLVFNANSLEIIHILNCPENSSVAEKQAAVKGVGVSKDGNYVGIGKAKSVTVIFSVKDNYKIVKKILGNHNQVWSLAFNQSNSLIAIGYRNNVIQIYDLKNDKSVVEHVCHADCYELFFVSDNFLIAQLDSKVYKNICFYKLENIQLNDKLI